MFSGRIRRMLLPAVLAAASVVVVLGASASAGATYPTCLGEPATIVGTDGNDHLTGTDGNDVIAALGGDDVVNGGGGLDMICGGDGNDTLVATTGGNWFFDAAMISGDAGDDRIQGAKDTLVEASYEGSPEPVNVNLTTGAETGWGNDTLVGVTVVDGSRLNDVLTGSARQDGLYGGPGNDTLSGLAGNDWLGGGPGADNIDGGTGRDWLDYYDATTAVRVGLGKHTASRGAGADTFRSVEMVYGSRFADVLVGGPGPDRLDGNAGNDKLYGGGGRDELNGGKGKDFADGGPARDVCRAETHVHCP
jgi:Ca2+-binding RTX toxin-like protein